MNITFAKHGPTTSGALGVLAGDGGALLPRAAALDAELGGLLKKAVKTAGFKGGLGETLDLLAPAGAAFSRLLVIGTGKAEKLTGAASETIGGAFYQALKKGSDKDATLALDLPEGALVDEGEMAARAGAGIELGAYRFDTHKSKKTDKPKLAKITVMSDGFAAARKLFKSESAAVAGTYLARDLVNEPSNVLFPKEFAKRCQQLEKLGVSVEVLGEKEMKKLGMGALLGVGQGSEHESQLVVMQWNGHTNQKGKTVSKPIAFVGKGVTFDTGGISIKPAQGMEDMKGDMGGAAAVTGLMHALAARKAKVNAVGVVGLVENMPDGRAYKPGDILTSMSGQTIEINNTDAEGRVVLADALYYTQDRFKPRFMIDLATLTGAIIVSLGNEHAGLFTPDDELAEQLLSSGTESGETLWRMPVGEPYAKLLESKFADMINTGGRGGGSCSAAEFLRKFVGETTWAHLDIASTAWKPGTTATSPSWGTGYGVRVLERLVRDYYEK